MAPRSLNPEEQSEILGEIGRSLSGAMRPGWAKATFTWSAVVGGGSLAALSVVDEEGESRAHDHPDGIGKLCGQLKNGMYRPGAGTWFTMTVELAADGSFRADFDYDNEPKRSSFIPEHYAKEIAQFPRDPEHVPNWLAAVLDRVPNVYIGVYAEPGEQYEDEVGPHPGEVARAFDQEGWKVGPGEYRGEFEFTTDWTALRTLSHYGLVRMAGKIPPGRWDDLLALLARQGWNFGATLYEGEDIVAQVDPPRPTE